MSRLFKGLLFSVAAAGFLTLFALTAHSAESFLYPLSPGGRVNIQTSGNGTLPIEIVYTTDGAGNLIPIGSGGGGGDASEATLQAILDALPATLGQTTSGNSLGVVIASDQTVPVSASSLPLPAGAATNAKLDELEAKLDTVIANQTNGTQTSRALDANGNGVHGAELQPGVNPWQVVMKNPDDNTNMGGTGSPVVVQGSALGTPLPVVTASSPVLVADKIRFSYDSTPVTTGSPETVVAATADDTTAVEIFDSGGEVMELFVIPPSDPPFSFYITPGGNGRIPLTIEVGSQVDVQAVTANVSTGDLVINFYK